MYRTTEEGGYGFLTVCQQAFSHTWMDRDKHPGYRLHKIAFVVSQRATREFRDDSCAAHQQQSELIAGPFVSKMVALQQSVCPPITGCVPQTDEATDECGEEVVFVVQPHGEIVGCG